MVAHPLSQLRERRAAVPPAGTAPPAGAAPAPGAAAVPRTGCHNAAAGAAQPAGMIGGPFLSRRSLLALPPGLLAGAARAAGTAPVLLVPGPENGAAMRWATRLAHCVGRLPGIGTPQLSVTGGPDGVTAANRFATTEAPDGQLLLVLTGAALLARLSGSARVGYEVSGWTPLCLSWGRALVAGRGPMPVATQRRPPLRFPLPGPEAPEAGALLALESLGLAVAPTAVPPAGEAGALAEAGFAGGALDALLLFGPDPAARARALGATPWFGWDTVDAEVPGFATLLPAASPLRDAVGAVLGSAQLHAGLMLPPLTAADVVATWRQGAARWREAERAAPAEGQPLVGSEAAAVLAALAPRPDAVLAWRDWLSRRLGWRPA
ncbi:hypothetical protein [Roseomonas sp. BN140053]|uniref:hypothetical protein n=1 Tax=Roseomonas sp. BN140053 TaxID=3391898 RepID=UPI0039EBC041